MVIVMCVLTTEQHVIHVLQDMFFRTVNVLLLRMLTVSLALNKDALYVNMVII